jgi:hypothetical protein
MEIETRHIQTWRYETDEFNGTCVIANDDMIIKFIFEAKGNAFYDVLKIDKVIRNLLAVPVSVEGICDSLADEFEELKITVMGRAESHGWITSSVEND